MNEQELKANIQMISEAVEDLKQKLDEEKKQRQAVEAATGAHLRQSIESLRARVAKLEAVVENHATLLVTKTLPEIQKQLHYAAGIDGDIDRRLRHLEQHFRPWPEPLPTGGCNCG